MGAMAAAVNKKGEDAVSTVVAMLKELTHRGDDAHGVSTPNSTITAESVEQIPLRNIGSNVVLGHNLSRSLLKDQPQPVRGKGFTLVFEGRLFPSPMVSEVNKIVEKLGPDPCKNISNIIEELEGSYVFAIAISNKIIAGRDLFGTNPLYYGENDNACAIASERKALWTQGIENVKSFPPGHIAVFGPQGFVFKPIKTITQSAHENVGMETAAKILQDLLLESTRKRVSETKKVAVAFSGGVDSSVIAVLTKLCGAEVQLVSVGLENQPEVEFAETAAEALGLPIYLKTYKRKHVEQILPKILWLIEEPDTVKVSIAIPFYWTAENVSKLGCNILLAGQGGDELFGGYQRYARDYEQLGNETTQKIMYRDLARSYETNFQRDNQACSFHKVELRFPFVDRDVVRFSLGLPLSLKIKSAADRLRKRVLRQVACNIGLPPFIAGKTKKAIQYTTGVNKAIQRLAKRKGLTMREYVEEIFRRAYSILGTPK